VELGGTIRAFTVEAFDRMQRRVYEIIAAQVPVALTLLPARGCVSLGWTSEWQLVSLVDASPAAQGRETLRIGFGMRRQ
jgi:hypothetical protein